MTPVSSTQPHCAASIVSSAAPDPVASTQPISATEPKPIRASPTVQDESDPRSRLATTTSIAHSSVAARISNSPEEMDAVNPPDNPACPTSSSPIAIQCQTCSRSLSTTTASSATHNTRVLFRNAAWVDDARARPSKNSTNGTLPPITPTATRPHHWLRPCGRLTVTPRARPAATTPNNTRAATTFFAVV